MAQAGVGLDAKHSACKQKEAQLECELRQESWPSYFSIEAAEQYHPLISSHESAAVLLRPLID
jgi:hypothetical protein